MTYTAVNSLCGKIAVYLTANPLIGEIVPTSTASFPDASKQPFLSDI